MHAGVLKWKKEGERLLQGSGLPWTIVRPNRLTDGPYTSYDLNTLLKVGSGSLGLADPALPIRELAK